MSRCRLPIHCGTYALALYGSPETVIDAAAFFGSSQNIACKFTHYNLIVYFEIGDDMALLRLTSAKPRQTYRIAIWLCHALKTKQHIFERGRRQFIVCICLGRRGRERAQTNKSNVWKWHLLLCFITQSGKKQSKTTATTAARCILPFVCWVSIEWRKCYQIEKTCQIVIRFNWHCFG